MCVRERERERERERVRGPHLDREKVASQDRIVYCGFSEVPVVHGRGVCTRFHQNSDDARVTRPCRSADERSLEDVPRVDVKGPRSAALSREERPGANGGGSLLSVGPSVRNPSRGSHLNAPSSPASTAASRSACRSMTVSVPWISLDEEIWGERSVKLKELWSSLQEWSPRPAPVLLAAFVLVPFCLPDCRPAEPSRDAPVRRDRQVGSVFERYH